MSAGAAPGGAAPLVELRRLTRRYGTGPTAVVAVDRLSLAIARGEFVALMGPSGSGKSTLLHLIGCLDRPTGGEYLLDGRPVARLDDDALAGVRNRSIGFVFQSFNLLPRMPALRNVEQPMIYAGAPRADRRRRAEAVLTRVGLADRMHHRPNQLSGGQQQRVAIARALVNHPVLLLADEPTGNLDSRSGAEVLDLFQELNAAGMTILVVTHNDEVAGRAGRVLVLRDGRIQSDERNGAGWPAAPAAREGTPA